MVNVGWVPAGLVQASERFLEALNLPDFRAAERTCGESHASPVRQMIRCWRIDVGQDEVQFHIALWSNPHDSAECSRELVPRDHCVGSSRNILEHVSSNRIRLCTSPARSHDDGSSHIRMEVAIYGHNARRGEHHSARLTFRVVAQIETLDFR